MEIDLVGQRMNARGVPEMNGFRPGLHTHAKDLHLSAANFIHSHWQCTEVLHIHAVPDPKGVEENKRVGLLLVLCHFSVLPAAESDGG